MSRSPASALEEAGAEDGDALDLDLQRGPSLHVGDDPETLVVDEDGVAGAGRAEAGAPVQGDVGDEGPRALGHEGDFAGRVAGHGPLVVVGPLVGTAELLVHPAD